ncbi:helix-turn-helix domain-containing protein [Kineosporia sp. J2-2]|uniref:Helix-turn-helix domain-containing protein n=1 Tax=Kineosporia corallincola TaxID=2835133 RepID=A0ABS5T9J8_9ACTN|nr:helix-turn-helix domain-containing protein [Kineosporia corallincola]MBT0767733.1 helix-turn-helix domain-containing protein [Kineosporia corallincola]
MTSATGESDPRALQDLVDDVSDLLQAPATLEDTGFALLAYGSHGPDGVDQVRAASILRKTATPAVRSYFLEHGIASATAPVRIPADESRQIAARVCVPVRAGGRTHGYFWVVEPTAGVDAASLVRVVPLAERAGVLLARRAGVADERAGLVAALLFGGAKAGGRPMMDDEEPGPRAAWRRLVALGELSPQEPLVVAVVREADGTVRHTVLSVPAGAAPDLIARRVARQVPAGAVAGFSGPCPPPAETVGSQVDSGVGVGAGAGVGLPAAAVRAATALRTAIARPHLGPVLSWDDLGFYRVLEQGPEVVAALIAGTPAARLRERADADLIRTVLVWLDSGGNAARTAAALSVHRQTLYYRLERVEQLTGVDLDEGEARLGLHLGLALSEVLAVAPPVPG